MFTFFQYLFTLLFGGDTCVRCGAQAGIYPLCPSCLPVFAHGWQPLADASVPRCRVCGKVLLSEIGVCSACRTEPILKSTDGVFPLHAYRLWKKSLMFAWKMEGRRTLSPVFARMYADALRRLEAVIGKDVPLVPVPPRPGKIRERGWDQIADVCRLLHRRHHKKILPLLVRKSRVQQKKLDRTQRLNTRDSAYVLKDARQLRRLCPKPPQSVVLIDDVMTTGATIESCAVQLRRFGVQKVYALTLFAVG